MRLLLVEDDAALSRQIKTELSRAQYAVDTADNGIDAEHLGDTEPYDLIVLDLGLPQRSGLEVLQHWRAKGNNVPVIVLTARDAWHERVTGFKAGADDYVGKPFHMEELLARISAVIKRQQAKQPGGLTLAGFTLDETKQSVTTPDGQSLPLTGTEFRLLRYFMTHPDQVLSKTRLTEHVYEYDAEKDSNVIEVYIKRLRLKIGDDAIQTRRGQGYVMRSQR